MTANRRRPARRPERASAANIASRGPVTLRARPLARRPEIRLTIGITAAFALLSLLSAACSGQHAAAPAPRPAAPSSTTALPAQPRRTARSSSSPGSPAPVTSAPLTSAPAPGAPITTPPGPVFQTSTSVLSPTTRAKMTGVSWHPGCPVSLDRLRLLRISYWGFDHAVHQGELIVNSSAATSLTRAFRLLFAARFPIRQIRVVDAYDGDDERSMIADNTSAFNCRRVPGMTAWSQHAYGLAVDINPFENPEVQNGTVDPPAAIAWTDRTRSSPAMIVHGDAASLAFSAIGWTWGGDWTSLKDYQHFSASGL